MTKTEKAMRLVLDLNKYIRDCEQLEPEPTYYRFWFPKGVREFSDIYEIKELIAKIIVTVNRAPKSRPQLPLD